MTDAILRDLQERVRAAAAAKAPLRIRGGGSKDFYGGELTGECLETAGYDGIVEYDPAELVLTARAGTPLADVERTLEGAGQMLAFEPPHFGPRATLGGAVAAGLSGPRRPYAGAVRDLVLGVRIIDGAGDDLRFGGRVMKNVAGFDVPRLMTGALGTLGVLTEISLKCLPRPRAQATRVYECSADEAIRRANEWGGQPLPVSATCFHRGRLAVRFSGSASGVAAATSRLGGETVPDDDRYWNGVREQTHPFFEQARSTGAPLWRLSVKSTAPFTDLGGEQMIEWSGALRWLAAGERTDPARVRAWAASHGGHGTLFRANDKSPGAFHPLAPAVAALHQRLKSTFDPHRILNPGRMYADF